MLSIMGVLGSHEFKLQIWLGAQWGSQIITGWEDIADGSAALPMLSQGLKSVLSDSEGENVRLTGDYLWQVVEIVIGGVPTFLEVRFMYIVRSLHKIMLQCPV
jgi:hypothetical protein